MLRDDGFAIVIEVTTDYEIALFVDGLQGRDLDTGDDRRIYGCYFTRSYLEEIINEADYKICLRQTDPALSTTAYVSIQKNKLEDLANNHH